MARNIKSLKAVAPAAGEVLPHQDIGKSGRLNTAKNIRVEAGRVYRRVCDGYIPVEDGTKLFYMLDRLSRMVEAEVFEARIDAIEHNLKAKG